MKRLVVGIPSSILSVEHGLLLKTMRVYQVIRFSSIYSVSEIIVYRDPFTRDKEHNRYSRLFKKIHRYLTTPPYLRKKIVPLDKDLRFIGVVPPLRLEIYNVSSTGFIGEKRLGLLISRNGRLYVDLGLDRLFEVVDQSRCNDELVYVVIQSLDPPKARCLDEKPYTGPRLVFMNSFREVVDKYRVENSLLIATSRYGKIPSIEELRRVSSFEDVIVLFGSPKHGLYDIAEEEGFNLVDYVDRVWNTIPNQRVKTIRTEEALISTLAILNMFINR